MWRLCSTALRKRQNAFPTRPVVFVERQFVAAGEARIPYGARRAVPGQEAAVVVTLNEWLDRVRS